MTDGAAVPSEPAPPITRSETGRGQIAYIASLHEVRTLDVGTGASRVVARSDPDMYLYGTSWSVAADAIAFGENGCAPGIICEPTSGSVRVVDLATGATSTLVTLPSVNILSVAWSPDGTRIAFVTGGAFVPLWGAPYEGQVVHIVNADGTGARPLTQGREPTWSPDSKELAFQSHERRIAIVNVDAPVPRTVSPVDLFANWPSWSPDGNVLAFVGSNVNDAWTSSIWIVGVDGGNPRSLPHATYNPLTWSPDGMQLVFAHNGLFAINVNSTLVVQLSTDGYMPTWSPDGTSIAYYFGGTARLAAADGTVDRELSRPADFGSIVWAR